MAHARTGAYDRAELIGLVWKLVHDEVFDPADFVLAGSARLLREGIVEHVSDIDVVARGATLDRAFALSHDAGHGGLMVGENTGDKIAQLYHGKINVSARWLDREESIDALIEHAEVVDGLRYFRIADVIAYKRLLNRPKDRSDLAALASG